MNTVPTHKKWWTDKKNTKNTMHSRHHDDKISALNFPRNEMWESNWKIEESAERMRNMRGFCFSDPLPCLQWPGRRGGGRGRRWGTGSPSLPDWSTARSDIPAQHPPYIGELGTDGLLKGFNQSSGSRSGIRDRRKIRIRDPDLGWTTHIIFLSS